MLDEVVPGGFLGRETEYQRDINLVRAEEGGTSGSPKSPNPECAMFENIWTQRLLFSRGKEPEFPCVGEPWKFFTEGSQAFRPVSKQPLHQRGCQGDLSNARWSQETHKYEGSCNCLDQTRPPP